MGKSAMAEENAQVTTSRDSRVAGVENRTRLIQNPYIKEETEDQLFHLVFDNKNHRLPELFGDIKFVCMGGTARRLREFANFIANEIAPFYPMPLEKNASETTLTDLTENGHRFSMFKVGCVLCVNHGIGYSSITIVLHEVIKLLHHSRVEDPIIFRIGTSGGFGPAEGTVVIADRAVNDYLEEYHEIPVLGERVKNAAKLDQKLINELKTICEGKFNFPLVTGKTMSHENFYESVASPSGAICERSNEERKTYYELLEKNNVLNADMEITAFASITHSLGIKSAVVNVVVNNIIEPSKKEKITADSLMEWQRRPQKVVAEYIKFYLSERA